MFLIRVNWIDDCDEAFVFLSTLKEEFLINYIYIYIIVTLLSHNDNDGSCERLVVI